MSTLYSTNTFRTNQYFLYFYSFLTTVTDYCDVHLYSTNTFITNQYFLYFYSFLTTVTDYCDVHLVLDQHVQNQSVFSLLFTTVTDYCDVHLVLDQHVQNQSVFFSTFIPFLLRLRIIVMSTLYSTNTCHVRPTRSNQSVFSLLLLLSYYGYGLL